MEKVENQTRLPTFSTRDPRLRMRFAGFTKPKTKRSGPAASRRSRAKIQRISPSLQTAERMPSSSRRFQDHYSIRKCSVPANGSGYANGTAAPAAERSKTKLEDALKTVVAACHAAREYAKQISYEGMPPFTSEDIRTMANTLMIQNGNGGAR
jgi:hypothetical protein